MLWSFKTKDGFPRSKKIKTDHFVIYAEKGSNIILDSDEIEELCLEVNKILKSRIKTLKINLKICKNQESLKKVYKSLFNREMKKTAGFFIEYTSTIYISATDLNKFTLGHEIAHGILTYQSLPYTMPNVQQEVLAGFVEYNLRKKYDNK